MRLFSLIFFVLFVDSVISDKPALAKGWNEAIAEVEARADDFWNFGISQGASSHIGTMYNEVDVFKHRCAILGRVLEQGALVTHLEKLDAPEKRSGMTEIELHALMVYAHSLRNWSGVAKSILDLDDDERRNMWNLDCVGQQGIPPTAYLAVSKPRATFRQEEEDLYVLGDIEDRFSLELLEWLEANPGTKRVVLGSGGGNVREAISAGLIIRARGLGTTLFANCYSACPLVFLGGVDRVIWSPYPKLGFHQAYSSSVGAYPPNHEIYTIIYVYAERMGVNPSFLINAMLSAPPASMFEPDFELLCASQVATFVQRLCT